MDKWQSLEGKGEKEVETLRSRRIELEVRVKELEVNLKESRSMDKKIKKLEVLLSELLTDLSYTKTFPDDALGNPGTSRAKTPGCCRGTIRDGTSAGAGCEISTTT